MKGLMTTRMKDVLKAYTSGTNLPSFTTLNILSQLDLEKDLEDHPIQSDDPNFNRIIQDNLDNYNRFWRKRMLDQFSHEIKELAPGHQLAYYLENLECMLVEMTYTYEINGETIPLSTFMTLVLNDETYAHGLCIDHIQDLENTPALRIIHTHNDHIPRLIDEIKNLECAVLNWDGKETHSLQDTLVQLRYLYSHTMTYRRGSAAIANWSIEALLAYHGYQEDTSKWASATPAGSVDDYAMGLPFDVFREKYLRDVSLIKKIEAAS